MKPDVEPAYVIEDVIHGQWSSLTRERRIRQAYWVEQEPGSGGKESAERTASRPTTSRSSASGHPCCAG